MAEATICPGLRKGETMLRRLLSAFFVWLAALSLFAGGCAKDPVLRTDEAVPASIENLDEATSLVSRRHVSNFKLCVQRSKLVDDAGLAGKPMDLAFSITPKGEAIAVRMLSPRFAGTAFASCVQRILTWIRFPSPGDDARQVRLRLYLDEKAPLRR
jgi:hypothetical protein